MTINLDDVFGNDKNKKKPEQKQKQPEADKLAPVGGGLVLAKDAGIHAPVASGGTDLKVIYDRFKRLYYVFDISTSMRESVAGADDITRYIWGDDQLDEVDKRALEAKQVVDNHDNALTQQIATAIFEGESAVEGQGLPQEPTELERRWASVYGLAGDELKRAVLQQNLHREIGIGLDFSRTDRDVNSKLGQVKKMAKKMIEERMDKYPNAEIKAIAFNTDVSVMEADTKEALLQSIADLQAVGGTYICRAIEWVIADAKANPNKVNMNHVVLVSDGEDYSAKSLPGMVPQLLKHGVSLDFIYVTQPGAEEALSNPDTAPEEILALKQVCAETAGSFVVVTNAKDFETKFIEASQRLMLPAASSK